jgi:dimethylhistidine N-methyltransferase
VLSGLGACPKFLHSKYFYDAAGDQLFQQIMALPEYYLTRCELEIFAQQTGAMAQTILNKCCDFDILELGAGDATKSIFLLQWLKKLGLNFTYYPVDISANVIHRLKKELPQKIPGLKVNGLQGEYHEMIGVANRLSGKNKLVLFLGANIGNFSPEEAKWFLKLLNKSLQPGDLLLMGVDLKKNPQQILSAYDDKAGITRQFNLNLLVRMNRELGANFNVAAFDHYPSYNPVTGACRSYLISLRKQMVYIADWSFAFEANEPVYMELSQKYTVTEIDVMARQTGFHPVSHFFDRHHWFVNAMWQKVT